MKFIESLASYVPGLIVDRLIKECDDRTISRIPWRQKYETVCLFCDVSGFTALSEAMALNGKGAEGLAKHLNSYFGQMLRLIASDGGDVFKFAGDAIIVLWPEGQDDMETTVRRAAQCAYSIQENLDKSLMEEGVRLSVKIGIGFGNVSVMHVGGVYGRVEYLAVGDPLIQAFHAEHKSVSGQVICSKEVWTIISEYFVADCIFPDGYARLDMESRNKMKLVRKTAKINMLRHNMSDTDPVLEGRIKGYVAGAVLPNLNRDSPEDEQWGNELRRCTVLFVNLGLKEQHLLAAAVYDEAMVQVHEVLVTAQKSVYQYEGSINKFLMDDKGSTLIACFGLPPVSHDDDAVRAVLAALLLCEGLYKLGLIASIGITTGQVFCGVVGGKTRREYTVLGDSVNLSARLMQKANSDHGGVLCDLETKLACRGAIDFITLEEIRVKGKSMAIRVFRPYPADEQVTVTGFKGPNPYTQMHIHQLQSAIVHRALRSLNSYFFPTRAVVSRPTVARTTSLKNSTSSVATTNLSLTSLDDNTRFSSALKLGTTKSQTSSVLDLRPSGAALRTRRSVVRATLNSTSSRHLNSTEDMRLSSVKKDVFAQTPIPTAQNLATKVKGSNKPFFIDHMLSSSSAESESLEFNLSIPKDLHLESLGLEVNLLSAISIAEVTNFSQLLQYCLEMGVRLGYIGDNISESDLVINVLGTRFFLPVESYDIKWLAAFIYEGKQGLGDEWRIGQNAELVLCKREEKRKLQSRLSFAHCVLLENKIKLLSGHCSFTVLEGEAGVGKTHLLARFIGKTLHNACPIYYSMASAYSMQPFGPFSMIIQQFLDNRVLQAKKKSTNAPSMNDYENMAEGDENEIDVQTSSPMEEEVTRTSLLREILQMDSRMLRDAMLLDEYIGTCFASDYKENEVDRDDEDEDDLYDGESPMTSLSPSEIIARRMRLYLYILLYIANQKPLIIIIDDAHNMDDESWALVLLLELAMSNGDDRQEILGDVKLPDILVGYPKIMFIISLRPMKTNRTAFRGVSQAYEALVKKSDILFLKLDGLPPEELEDLLLHLLGTNVVSFNDQILKLVEVKCMGNPWMIQQLIEALMCVEPPLLIYTPVHELTFLDDDSRNSSNISMAHNNDVSKRRASVSLNSNEPVVEMHVALIEGFQFDHFPIPSDVAKSFSSKIDRLNSCQQMILKTSAKIGHNFKWSFLYNCYPLEGHKYRLKKEMLGLLAQGYIVEIPSTSVDKDQNYHFVSAFFVDLLLSLMLKEQKDLIENKIIAEHNNIQMNKRKQFLDKSMSLLAGQSGVKVLKSGTLEIQKKISDGIFKLNFKRPIEGGDWKSRYCIISSNDLSMYKDKGHHSSSPANPTQVIYFNGASCDLEPPLANDGRQFVLHIDAIEYRKEKTNILERRRFIFACESQSEIDDWVYMIKYAIEMKVRESDRLSMSRNSSSSTKTPLSVGATASEGDNPLFDKIDKKDSNLHHQNPDETHKLSDMLLHVTINDTQNMVSSDVYGSSNCYVSCLVDEDLQRTPVLSGTTRNHKWNITLIFPITKMQYYKSHLSVGVLDKDFFLTDDVLGTTTVDLSRVLVRNPINDIYSTEVTQSARNSTRLTSMNSVNNGVTNTNTSISTNNNNIQYLPLLNKEMKTSGEIGVSLSITFGKTYHDMIMKCEETVESILLRINEECRKSVLSSTTNIISQEPASRATSFVRLNSIDEIKTMLTIASVYETDEAFDGANNNSMNNNMNINGSGNGNHNSAGSSNGVTKKNKMPNSKHQQQYKKIAKKVNEILKSINEQSSVSQPTAESGAINKMWLLQELRPLAKKTTGGSVFAGSTSILDMNPYAHIMEQAQDLDQQHIDWLSSQYTQNSSVLSSKDSNTKNEIAKSDMAADALEKFRNGEKDRARRSSISPSDTRRRSLLAVFDNPTENNDLSPRFQMGGSPLLSPFAKKMNITSEPPLFDKVMPQTEGYYYKDSKGQAQGPYSAQYMYSNYLRHIFHAQVPVHHGCDGHGNYYPYAMYEISLRRIVIQNNVEWVLDGVVSLFDDDHQIHNYTQWDFDVWKLQSHEVFPFSLILMSSLGIKDTFRLNFDKWKYFISKIEHFMTKHENPYHNYFHITDVMHTCYIFLTKYELINMFQPYEILSLMVGALVHDLDHPGTNNLYQVNARTKLSILYNDISVLENHHCALAFDTISHPKCGIFDHLDLNQYKSVRRLIISIVLATDMTCHFALKGDLDGLISKKFVPSEEILAEGDSTPITVLLEDKEREMLLKTILHISDISNPAKCWSISKHWSDLVVAEFFVQGDKEKREGLPVSPNMDRDTTHQDELSINFADFIVAPFFISLTSIIPSLSDACIQLEENRSQWHSFLVKRMSASPSASTEETIGKWEKRKSTFAATVSSKVENKEANLVIARRRQYMFK